MRIFLKKQKKYTRRVDFKNESPQIYDAAVSQRLLSKACAHMRGLSLKNYWTYEKCLETAKSCRDRSEFCKRHPQVYGAARKNGWLADIYELANLRSLQDMTWLKPAARRKFG